MTPEVLFLGTGIMGAPMARRIREAGFTVLAWNRSPHKATLLEPAGITAVPNLAALPAQRRVAILMVSTGPVADEVLFGSTASPGAVEALTPGSTVVVMSSIPVETARTQAARLARRDISYLDAPVSGGERAAKAGTLSIMVGGDASTVAKVEPVLAAMGTVTHIGSVGTGALAKLANQAIVGITIGAVAEALALAELGGADLRAVRTALGGGFADSTILRQHGERMLSGNFRPGAHAATQLKDLATALTFGERAGGQFPVLKLCTDLYRRLCESERRSLDHSALYLDARDRARLPSLSHEPGSPSATDAQT